MRRPLDCGHSEQDELIAVDDGENGGWRPSKEAAGDGGGHEGGARAGNLWHRSRWIGVRRVTYSVTPLTIDAFGPRPIHL